MGLFVIVWSWRRIGGVSVWVLGVKKGNVLEDLVDEGQCIPISVCP